VIRAEQDLLGSEVGGGERIGDGGRRGEMAQTMYVHMKNE
jgi:hypothetical protein